MATYVLIPGAADDSFHWYRLIPELERRGHEVVAPDLPCDDDRAGFAEYAQAVLDAIGERRDLIVVAVSLGGFTAPIVAARAPVRLLVFLNGMVPRIGEPPSEYWDITGWEAARRDAAGSDNDEFDPVGEFYNDVPADVVAAVTARPELAQSETPMSQPYPLTEWPDVPVRYLLARDDRFFPSEYQRRVARERLGVTADEMPGGHSVALGRPVELAERLEEYRTATFPVA